MNSIPISNAPSRRPTIGFLVDWLEEDYQQAVLGGIVDSSIQHDCNLICFAGGGLRSPNRFGLERNFVYDLAGPDTVDAILVMAGTLAHAVGAALASTQSATSKYFQEDFNGGLDGWSHFVVDGKTYSVMSKDPNDMTLNVQDGFMVFDLEGKDEWVYSTYDTQTYDDVRVDVSAENRGANNNNVSLICRHTSDGQWYEFNIANNGLYNIYYAHTTEDNKIAYSPIADGGLE